MNQHDDITIMKWTIALEAQDQPFLGKLAVAWVIKNRAVKRRQSIAEVCFQRWQFSCWTPENGLADEIRRIQVTPDDVMLQCEAAATAVLEGRYITDPVFSDPTNGADHYLNIELTKKQRGDGTLPGWVSKLIHTAKIGDHDFYKEP